MNQNTPDTLLADIADYVLHHAVGEEALEAAHLCFVDALACALDALDHPECTRLLGPLIPGTVVPNGACVPGTSHVLDPATAAFSLGCMIRWLDYNDATSGALTTHPSDALAGILSVADHLSRQRVADGESPLPMDAVFDAMVRAYEIQGALGLLTDWRKYGIDQPLLTRVASAPVIARLLGGGEEAVLSAVSNAFIDTSLSVVRNAPNIGPRKNWATADASHAAVRLAYFALRGEPAYPWVLSAKELGLYAARMGGDTIQLGGSLGDDVIRRVMFKFVPAGMHGQTAAECAFRLHPLVSRRLDEVERIELRCHRTLTRIMDKRGPLRNAADRDHCVQYIVAVGLLQGHIGPHDFEDGRAAEPRIDALRSLMNVEEDPRYTQAFSDPEKRSSANAIEVFFRDGSSSGKVEVEYPAGHPRRRAEALPMLRDKFHHALARRFHASRLEHIASVCQDFATLRAMPVNEVLDMLRP